MAAICSVCSESFVKQMKSFNENLLKMQGVLIMQEQIKEASYDVLVIGGGIAGGEAALNLANNGFKVLIVEKDLSIGGKMILLSKVFPTLDCSACITTPKVSEISRHPGITIFTGSEVKKIVKKTENSFEAEVIEKSKVCNCGRLYRLPALRTGLSCYCKG